MRRWRCCRRTQSDALRIDHPLHIACFRRRTYYVIRTYTRARSKCTFVRTKDEEQFRRTMMGFSGEEAAAASGDGSDPMEVDPAGG